MKKDDYIRAKQIFSEIDELQEDINHINYVCNNSASNEFSFVIMGGFKIHITRDELKMLVENRKQQKEQLEKEFNNL